MITYEQAMNILRERGWSAIEGSDMWQLGEFLEAQQQEIEELRTVIEQIEPQIPQNTYVALVPVLQDDDSDEDTVELTVELDDLYDWGIETEYDDEDDSDDDDDYDEYEDESFLGSPRAPKVFEPTPDEKAEAMAYFASMVEISRAKSRAELDMLPDSFDGFKELVRSGAFVVLDTETTGLPKYYPKSEICQIAIVDSVGNTLLDTLVKPKHQIPSDATAIHGITNDMVATAPTWGDVVDLVDALISTRHVVVYNATFDRQMMHKSAEQWNLPKREWKEISRFWCAMEMFAPIYGEYNSYHGNYKWQTLSTAAYYYDLVPSDAHTALGDCLTTLAVVKAMAK